jgi:hypothetical protein
MTPTIPPREKRASFRAERQNVKVALVGRVKEFPAEPRFRSWLERIGEIAALPVYAGEYALYVGRRRVFGIGLGIVGVAVLLAFIPRLRSLLWPGIAWALLIVSAIVVLGVAVSILVAVVSMYTGYSSASDELRKTGSVFSDIQDAAVPFAGQRNGTDDWIGRRTDILYNLHSAECALFKLETSSGFETLTGKQKSHYYQVLGQLQILIRDISNESNHHRIAS